MKMFRRPLSLLLGWCLLTQAGLAAGPTRDEVKAWTSQYEAGLASAKKLNLVAAHQQLMGALKLAEKFGPKDIRLAENLSVCGKLLQRVGQPAAAEPILRRAATVWEAVRGDSHRETAWAWLEHAEVLTALDKFSEAEALIQRAKRNLEKAFGPYHTSIGTCLAAQGKIKARQKQFTEAEELYKNALRFLSRTSTTIRGSADGFVFHDVAMGKMVVAQAQAELAELYLSAERPADAVAAYREVVKLVEAKQGKQGPAIPGALVSLAKAQMKQKDYAGAAATIERALQLAANIYGSEHPATVITRFAKVNLLIAQEKWNEAEIEGVVTMSSAAAVLHGMSLEWIPLIESMVIINEKLGNPDNAKLHRERIADLKKFHAARFAAPPE